MPLKRQAILIAVMLVLLAIFAGWSVQSLLAQRASARLAAEDLVVCRQLAASIEALRNNPQVASAHDLGLELLGQRIATASQRANLDAQSLDGIYPQSARRLGNSPYVEKPTTLALRNVTLPTLVSFLHYLTDDQSGLNVRDLRIRTPRGDAASQLWDAEATITCLIFEPLTTGHR